MADESGLSELQIDRDNLYREEVITDRHIGTIQRLVPVTREGTDDDSREIRYLGQTQVMTPAGALPLSFELDVKSLSAAMDAFPQAAQQALEQTMEELKDMQRESGSRIVTPDQGGYGGGQGGGGFQLR